MISMAELQQANRSHSLFVPMPSTLKPTLLAYQSPPCAPASLGLTHPPFWPHCTQADALSTYCWATISFKRPSAALKNLRYAEKSDKAFEAELRVRRRK